MGGYPPSSQVRRIALFGYSCEHRIRVRIGCFCFALEASMRKLWNMRWFRVLFGVVLTAALLAPVVLPALQMQQKEPENPIRKENIQPVRRLSFGDGDGGTLAASGAAPARDHRRAARDNPRAPASHS